MKVIYSLIVTLLLVTIIYAFPYLLKLRIAMDTWLLNLIWS